MFRPGDQVKINASHYNDRLQSGEHASTFLLIEPTFI
jgi:hypothetical protein